VPPAAPDAPAAPPVVPLEPETPAAPLPLPAPPEVPAEPPPAPAAPLVPAVPVALSPPLFVHDPSTHVASMVETSESFFMTNS
jgi:hypothetical protein